MDDIINYNDSDYVYFLEFDKLGISVVDKNYRNTF